MPFIGPVSWAVRNDSNRGTDAGQTKKAAPAAKKNIYTLNFTISSSTTCFPLLLLFELVIGI